MSGGGVWMFDEGWLIMAFTSLTWDFGNCAGVWVLFLCIGNFFLYFFVFVFFKNIMKLDSITF